MTRGRKPLMPAEVIDVEVSQEALSAGTTALDVVGAHQRETATAVVEFAKQFEYQGSLNPDDLEANLKVDKEEMGNLVFRVGARLILLREQCPHGEFIQRTERAGYQPREVQRLMQAALMFSSSNASTSTHLNEQKIQALSKSKVFELFSLADTEVTELKETGSIRGITIDAMDCMSVSELRKELKKAKEDAKQALASLAQQVAVKERRVSELHTKNDALQEQLDTLTVSKDAARAVALEKRTKALMGLRDASLAMLGMVNRFDQAMHNVLALGDPSAEDDAANTLRATYQRLADLSIAHGMPVDFAETVTPSWMPPMTASLPASEAEEA